MRLKRVGKRACYLLPMTNKRFTVADIRAANIAAGGVFFSRANMKFAGDTTKSYGVTHDSGRVFLRRIVANKPGTPLAQWEFNHETGRLVYAPSAARKSS